MLFFLSAARRPVKNLHQVAMDRSAADVRKRLAKGTVLLAGGTMQFRGMRERFAADLRSMQPAGEAMPGARLIETNHLTDPPLLRSRFTRLSLAPATSCVYEPLSSAPPQL